MHLTVPFFSYCPFPSGLDQIERELSLLEDEAEAAADAAQREHAARLEIWTAAKAVKQEAKAKALAEREEAKAKALGEREEANALRDGAKAERDGGGVERREGPPSPGGEEGAGVATHAPSYQDEYLYMDR